MSTTTGILLLLLSISLVCIYSKSEDIKCLEDSLRRSNEQLNNAKNEINKYEDQVTGIAVREKECEKNNFKYA